MQPDVDLRLPAETAYVAVLRMTTAGIAARYDFTLDDIEDLRIAVGEACALVLEGADPGGSMRAEYFLGDGTISIRVSAQTSSASEPDRESFAWQVLSALTTDLRSACTDSQHSISLTISSGVLA